MADHLKYKVLKVITNSFVISFHASYSIATIPYFSISHFQQSIDATQTLNCLTSLHSLSLFLHRIFKIQWSIAIIISIYVILILFTLSPSSYLFVKKKITALFKPTQSAMLCLVSCSLSWLKGNMITFTGFKCIIMVFKWILNPSQWSYYGFLVQSFISLCD